MTEPSKAKSMAWIALLRAQRVALATVERALKDAGLPPLEWYDVLLELERGGPLRPRDLQDRLLLAQYNLSRLLARMAAAGLISRSPCQDDARCQWIAITEEGTRLRKRMWPVYGDAISQAIGGKLTETQADEVAQLLARISNAD